MSSRGDVANLNWPRWQQVLLIAALALLVGNRMTMLVDAVAVRAGIAGEQAWGDATFVPDPQAKPGFLRVTEVAPGGPMARAGVMAGDYLTFEHSYEYYRRAYVGERFNFTLDRQGVQSVRHVITEPLPWTEARLQQNTKGLLSTLAVIVSMLIGCSILWRGWANKTAMLLGAAMVSMGIAGINLPAWAGEPWLAVPMMSLAVVGASGAHLLLPLAMLLYEEQARPLRRWHWQMAYAWLALMACFMVACASDFIAVTSYLSWIGGIAVGRPVVEGVSFVASIAYLVAGWRRSAGAPRNRLALIVLALLAYALGIMVMYWSLALTGTFFASSWLGFVNALTMGLIAPSLLAYAVLRHKLFDLGFAVNRTLVFATISAVLLVGFGTLEWAVDHLFPEAWHKESAIYSAGIAVGLFCCSTASAISSSRSSSGCSSATGTGTRRRSSGSWARRRMSKSPRRWQRSSWRSLAISPAVRRRRFMCAGPRGTMPARREQPSMPTIRRWRRCVRNKPTSSPPKWGRLPPPRSLCR